MRVGEGNGKQQPGLLDQPQSLLHPEATVKRGVSPPLSTGSLGYLF